MKQLKFVKKGTPQGDLEIELLIKHKEIAVKSENMNDYARQFINAYKMKGARVRENRQYVIVNFFPDNQQKVKIGSFEFDFEEDTTEQIECKLCQFYLDTFSKAGFTVE